MMIGGVVFLLENKFSTTRKWLAITGYLLLGALSILLSRNLPWPGVFTLPSVLITGYIILCNVSHLAFIKNKAVQFIGRISYSLYLWHWPLIVLSANLGIQLHFFPVLVIILLSVALAYISFRYVESIKMRSVVPIFAVLAVLVTVSALFSGYDVNKVMFKPESIAIASYRGLHQKEIGRQMNMGSCFVEIPDDSLTDWKNYFKTSCWEIDSAKKNFLLLGDSHAAALSESLRDSLEGMNIHLLQCTQAASLPVFGQYDKHTVFDYFYTDYLVANKSRINGIIMAGMWDRPINKDYDRLVKNMQRTFAYIKSLNIPLIIIGENETYIIPYPVIAAKEFQFNTNSSVRYLDRTTQEVNSMIKEKFGDCYIDVINMISQKMGPNNTPYMVDRDHLSKYGADVVVGKVMSDQKFRDFLKN
jgi:hypothetical protein